ncbi:hypothetical protein ACWD4T_00685 [Streptomyces umbrinus]
MTASALHQQLSTLLNRAYVDHAIEEQSDGSLLLVLGDAPRIALQTLCGTEGLPPVNHHQRSDGKTQYTLTSSDVTDLAARIKKARTAK